ncbi:hypothetical protein I204_03070 [Kwoniella mangroviensis CBS 8886]|uniref:uncharacterized protein n=1 Tax=Kwoniella mangroviensis CBS 8507 TaxID=1296122 RepID=UPI00080CE7D0|nr:hypothetical protein I204_03070 [Kwoniella mangroviensis CBS 8886]
MDERQVNQADDEWTILEAAARSYGRRIHNVKSDGSSFYHAISYWLTEDEDMMSDHLRERNCNLMMSKALEDRAIGEVLDDEMIEKHRTKAHGHAEAEDSWIRTMSEEIRSSIMVVLVNMRSRSTFHQIFTTNPIIPGALPPLVVLGLLMTSNHFVVLERQPGKGNVNYSIDPTQFSDFTSSLPPLTIASHNR